MLGPLTGLDQNRDQSSCPSTTDELSTTIVVPLKDNGLVKRRWLIHVASSPEHMFLSFSIIVDDSSLASPEDISRLARAN